jgi:hypothetical protein
MSVVLIHTQQIVRRGAVVVDVFLETPDHIIIRKPILLHLSYDVIIYTTN